MRSGVLVVGWRDFNNDGTERSVIGIIEGVNDEMRRAGMLRVLREHLLRNRRGDRLASETAIGGAHRAEQPEQARGEPLVAALKVELA